MTATETNTIDIALDKLAISEHNTRPTPAETDPGIKELALSLAAAGQTAAILVRPHPKKKGHYEIAAGARRSVAAKVAGLKTLRASVREMDDDTFQTCILVDNLQRENPEPKAEAELLLKLHRGGKTATEIGAFMGKTERWINRRLKLLSCDPKILKAWSNPESNIFNYTIDMMELLGSLPAHDQIEIAESYRADQLRTRADLLESIRRVSPSLADAPFDLNDPAYFVKDCGPGCATDTSKQGDIFAFVDGKKKDTCARCLNGVCFNKRRALYTDTEYAKLCAEAGQKSLPVITDISITIKGSKYNRDWEDREYSKTKTEKPVVYVNGKGKLTLRYLKEAAKDKGGKEKKEEVSPADKLKNRINNLQGKRWLLVREKLQNALASIKPSSDLPELTADIDIIIATFGFPFKIEGSVMTPNDKRRWGQVLTGTTDKLKCQADGWSMEGNRDFGKAKVGTRNEVIWPHVQSVLLGLIPVPKRVSDAHLFEHDYRCIAQLIGFDIEAAKIAADIEILPPKSMGNVDPHTLKPIK